MASALIRRSVALTAKNYNRTIVTSTRTCSSHILNILDSASTNKHARTINQWILQPKPFPDASIKPITQSRPFSATLSDDGGLPPQKYYTEDVKSMPSEKLSDPNTIPGFATLIHSPPRDRNITPRNALVGRVVSDKMTKTVNVAVDRYRIIPKYRKRKKYTKKFMAHDEEELCKEGDLVMIVPCQRLSRRKHFRVHEIIKAKGQL